VAWSFPYAPAGPWQGNWTLIQTSACVWSRTNLSGAIATVDFPTDSTIRLTLQPSVGATGTVFTGAFGGDCCSPVTVTGTSGTVVLTPTCCKKTGGGGGISTVCCPGVNLPLTLHVSFTNVTGCTIPSSVPLTWNGTCWFYQDHNVRPLSVSLICDTAGDGFFHLCVLYDIDVQCSDGGDVNGPKPDVVSCSPFVLTWNNVSLGFSPTNCTGTVTITT
jgi:hypothetical protein